MGPQHVVVLGGGFAGLETAFALRHRLGDRVRISLVSDQEDFLFKPNTIYLPFGGDERRLRIPLGRPARRIDANLHIRRVDGVEPDAGKVRLSDGSVLPYDHLVLATGAAMRPDEISGLAEHAHTIWTPAQMHRLGTALARLLRTARAGRRQQVLFVVPPGNKCSGPLYEIVFMLETWLRRHGVRDRVDIRYTTYESGYIQAFGPRLDTLVREEFAMRRIEGHTGAVVSKITDREVWYEDGSTRDYDLLIAFPPYQAAVRYPGLPADDRGFLSCEPGSRQVVGRPELHAPGDTGDFPVKQAFLAFLQADAAAADIAAQVTARSTPDLAFEPVSMCVMEMFDKATFAQVPLRLTGEADRPVAVDETAAGRYRVGTGRIWRLGKKAIGLYLPWRFRAGRPFHEGLPWQGMALGLRAGARWLAK
jgi:NADH dehydrogenase FAD-containing subunit